MALLSSVVAVTVIVVVTQRLSQDSLALLVGLACGVGAMLPTILFGLYLWQRESNRQATQRTLSATPPVVVVTSQPPFGYGLQPPAFSDANMALQWNNPPQNRNFTIVGGEE